MGDGVVSARDALIAQYKAVQARMDAAARKPKPAKPKPPTHEYGAGFDVVPKSRQVLKERDL